MRKPPLTSLRHPTAEWTGQQLREAFPLPFVEINVPERHLYWPVLR
jgi:hypothetical protein